MNIVWFKRDLRVHDHEALARAAKHGPVLLLYILEPGLWHQPDMSTRHYAFLTDSLYDLDAQLKKLGQKLIIKVGDAIEVLQDIKNRHHIEALWSHQETWNHWTYTRDLSVKKWARAANIPWHEPTQNGVIRRLQNRNGWSTKWYEHMKKPMFLVPKQLSGVAETSDILPKAFELGLQQEDALMMRQRGGRSEGLNVLESFLSERGQRYSKEMSSPVTAFDSCSRLSTHFAFGTISIREAFQACKQRVLDLHHIPTPEAKQWRHAINAFSGRLRWHCHFIQKLEDEPRIEFENMHPAYNQLRQEAFDEVYFEAWKDGKTGYPMIDACMRALTATGWLNFRMRAMLMSFASYHLWLHWRKPALHLAQLFTDYEPGIHYSQVQMQSGTTGINAIRIYNPIKQGFDQDPEGMFIQQWLPELRQIESKHIHTPWLAKPSLSSYPKPIVDEKLARKIAADKLYGLRRGNTQHTEIAKKILETHGSRKSGTSKAFRKKKDNRQGELPL